MLAAPSSTRSPFTRRVLLKYTALGTAGIALGVGGTALLTRWGHEGGRPYLTFGADEAADLIAICERIVPRDDTPGATDLGVIHYIDRNLQGALSPHRSTYHRGLAQLQRWCVQEYGMAFAQLSPTEQDALLSQLEHREADPEIWRDPAADTFFALVISHTMQGFYGSPRHGGNRAYGSYRILGLDYPQIIGQNRYPEG